MRRIILFAVPAYLAVAAPCLAGSTTSVPRCHIAQLRLAATFYGEAGGQFMQTFTLTNASRHACSVRGWPRVAVESPTGRPIRTFSRRVIQGSSTAPPFRTVVLRPRAAGAFDVYGADWNHAADKPCPRTTAVLITPSGARSAISVAVRMPNCGVFDVAPVIAGSVDRRSWSVVWHG
jgi:Domain of unknown function (DUF4232)